MSRRALLIHVSIPMLAGLAACAHNPDPRSAADSAPVDSSAQSSDPALAQELRLSGRVVNSGTENFTITTLQVEGSPPTRLVGHLQSELRALAGAEVLVHGSLDSTGGARVLDARGYELLSINGRRPRVGTLLVREAGLYLAAIDTLRLIPELASLREHAGAKVWVVGSADSGANELRVESYGVITPAP